MISQNTDTNSLDNNLPNKMCLKPIIIDGNKIRHYKIFSDDKNEARQIFIRKINQLFESTYDNYRFIVPEQTPHVYIGIVDTATKDLAGIMIILRKRSRNIEHGEFGGSAVDKKYRGMGIQSYCVKEGAPYLMDLLMNGTPIFSEPRCFSFHSQLQCYNTQAPNNQGKIVPIGIPRGFYLAYLLEKDYVGDYILDIVILLDAYCF